MIVAIAGWLYIIQCLLGLASLYFGGSNTLASLLMSGLFGAMGYGLLQRERWGRWLALGSSLLGWVFGSLLLIGLLAALVLSGKSGAFISMMFSGAFAIVAVLIVIGLLLMLLNVVISFKLFFYLCSQDGCDEFDVPYGSGGTVAASVGAWIALMFGQVFLSGGGSSGVAMLLAQQAMSRDHRGDPERESARLRMEAQQREDQRDAEDRQRRAEQEARIRAIRDAENLRQLDAASAATAQQEANAAYSRVAEQTPAPEPAEEKTSGNTILKCRDASGSVMFTQGYCPPGTQRVEMPAKE